MPQVWDLGQGVNIPDLLALRDQANIRQARQGLSGDPTAYAQNAGKLLAAGDTQSGLSLLNLEAAKTRQATEDAWRRTQAAREQGNADRSFGLQKEQFNYTKSMKPADLKVVDKKIYDATNGVWITPPAGDGPGMEDNQTFDNISNVRKEFAALPSYKNFAQAVPIYRSMFKTTGTDSKASDLNLVYGLGKIMDPASVVREGEMIMVKGTSSLPDWLKGTINALNGGAAITPATRKAIIAEAKNRMDSYKESFDQDVKMYSGIADRRKIDKRDIIPDFGEIPAVPNDAGAPTPIVASPADAMKLPSGTRFRTPDGREKVRP